MHDLDSIHAKLKTFWGKLTQHRRNRASTTKTTPNMRKPPRKNKASAAPFLLNGSVPPDSKPLYRKWKKKDDEPMVDARASDEDMEDINEESEDGEGSSNAPSGATSEPTVKEVERVEDLVEPSCGPPGKPPCKFLVLMPREIRDKIYGYVLRMDSPMSDNSLKFKCLSCPHPIVTANRSPGQSQLHESRSLLKTCRQIRAEGMLVFYEVNSWTLHRARLRDMPVPTSVALADNQRLFDQLGKKNALKHFKHVNMQIPLSPLAYCDLTVPDYVALDDPLAVHLFELSLHPSVVTCHKLDETAQCDLFGLAIRSLSENWETVFPNMRSLTLEVSLHEKKMIPNAPNNPLDRCGITFYVRIKLRHRSHLEPTDHDNVSVPVSTPGSIMHDPFALQRTKCGAYSHSVQPSTMGVFRTAPPLEPKREMLTPLTTLKHVESVEVERRWTVLYRKDGIENGKVAIREQPLRQLWRFPTMDELLERAGPGFVEFLNPALGYLKTSPQDVVDIIENTWTMPYNVRHILIP